MDTDNPPVFRVVEGELAPVPGNKRDPNRRYSHVASPDGSYLREFTDEEERQRDLEEAEWEADRPEREAEARRKKEEFEQFRNSLTYEPRFAVFLDILGWTSAIRTGGINPLTTQRLGLALNVLRQHAIMVEWMQRAGDGQGWPGDPQMTVFSDCVFLSANLDLSGKEWLISTIQSLSLSLLHEGFLLRGGFVLSMLYHKAGIAFGPAAIEAYEIEQSTRFPRIQLQDSLVTAFGRGTQLFDKAGGHLGHFPTWRRAEDGKTFYDFLQPFPMAPGITHSSAHLDAHFGAARGVIVKGLTEYADQAGVKESLI